MRPWIHETDSRGYFGLCGEFVSLGSPRKFFSVVICNSGKSTNLLPPSPFRSQKFRIRKIWRVATCSTTQPKFRNLRALPPVIGMVKHSPAFNPSTFRTGILMVSRAPFNARSVELPSAQSEEPLLSRGAWSCPRQLQSDEPKPVYPWETQESPNRTRYRPGPRAAPAPGVP